MSSAPGGATERGPRARRSVHICRFLEDITTITVNLSNLTPPENVVFADLRWCNILPSCSDVTSRPISDAGCG